MEKTEQGKVIFYLLLTSTLIYAIVIFYLSASPSPAGAKTGQRTIPYFSYISHFVMYFLLTSLVYFTIVCHPDGIKFSTDMGAVMIAFLYGIFNEFFQLFVPGRSFSIIDILINGIGCISFIIILKIYQKHQF